MKTKHFHVSLGDETIHCSQSVSSKELSLPFSCDVTWVENESGSNVGIDDIFRVEPSYVDGRPACTFITRDVFTDKSKAISVADRTLALSVRLVDRNSHVEYNSHESTNIRFIPDLLLMSTIMTLSRTYMAEVIDVVSSYSQLSVIKVRSFLYS